MILTFVLSVMGIQSSPAFTMLGFTSRSPKGFAIHQIWGSAAVVGFILFIFSILIGVSANLLGANAAVNEAGLAIANYLPEISKEQHTELVIQFIKLFGNSSPWLVGFLAVCAIASLQATATSFMSTTGNILSCLLYTSPSPRDATLSRMPSSA